VYRRRSKMPAPEQLESNRRRRTRSRPLCSNTIYESHTIKQNRRTSPALTHLRTAHHRAERLTPTPSALLWLKFPGVIKQEDWYTMQAHGCKRRWIPRLTGSTRWLRRPRSVSKDEKDLRLSQGMYDMIEACLATKKIWMLSHSFLPL
jgi:hypothetical protein